MHFIIRFSDFQMDAELLSFHAPETEVRRQKHRHQNSFTKGFIGISLLTNS